MHEKETFGSFADLTDRLWDGESWDLSRVQDFAKAKPGRCVVIVGTFVIDATSYLGEHVSTLFHLALIALKPVQYDA